MSKKAIILWRLADGTYSQTPPDVRTQPVASTISERGIKKLAGDYHVFVLTLSDDNADLMVSKLTSTQ